MNAHLNLRRFRRPPSEKEYTLLTLDVFDTCVIRDFISQESLWYLLGNRVSEQLPGISSAADFVRLRVSAENYARSQSTSEDISLMKVYERVASICGWNRGQQTQAVALEEYLEAHSMQANPAARTLLAKVQGMPVSYLTDTPHRAAFISNCLSDLSLPSGTVLSSGDLGLRKGTGSLFREAIKYFDVNRREILHVGNDLGADGVGSALAGVAFAPLVDANPDRYERVLDSATMGVGLLGAVLAGCGRDFRLKKVAQSSALVSVVAGVAGPAIVSAAAWTLLSAQKDNVDTLYFAARDGEILLAVAKLLQQKLGIAVEIECRYLYGSRKAWHLPALTLVPESDFASAVRQLLVKSGKTTFRTLLSYLDFSFDDMMTVAAEVAADVSFDVPLVHQLNEVIDNLVCSPAFLTIALSHAKTSHEKTIGYLTQEKMFSSGRVGLVDIGWHGHASASLVAMAAARDTRVISYFAGGLCGLDSQLAPGDSRAYLIDARGEEPKLRAALVHLLETFYAGSGGTTLGYIEEHGQFLPRLAADDSNVATLWGLPDYQALVYSYAETVCCGVEKFEWRINLDELNALRPSLIENLTSLWRYPSYAEAELWGSFPFEGDSGTAMLARAFNLRDATRYIWYFRDAEKRPRFGPWSQAVVGRTIGGKLITHPFAPRHMLSPWQRQMLRAKARSKLSRRPTVSIEGISMKHAKITIYR